MKYIVAVSGGVDSVALLHMLHMSSTHNLVIAHVDHGIRENSAEDAWFVTTLAEKYRLPLEITRLALGSETSEDTARQARYAWLHGVQEKHGADGIVTAHHQDDVLETVALNFHRGTGWRGLASLRSGKAYYRPLINLPKATVVKYAIENDLSWREDETNEDIRYTRNYIRHGIIPKLDAARRQELVSLAQKQRELRQKIEKEVKSVVGDIKDKTGYSRYFLIMAPDEVSLEILKHVTEGACEPVQLRRLLHFIKTGRQGAVMQIGHGKNALLTSSRVLI